MIESEAKHFTSTKRRISPLDWPTPEQLLAARRERGLVLRAMIVAVARKVSRAFAGSQKQRNGSAAKSPSTSAG